MKSVRLIVALCAVPILISSASAEYVIDDFEEGGPFLVTTDPNGIQTEFSYGINVPGGVRRVQMNPSDDPEKQGTVELFDTPGDDGLVVNAFNPPNRGFIPGNLVYGGGLDGQPDLNLDLSGFGNAFYIDLSQEEPGYRPWSGFYIIIQINGIAPHFPDGIGTQNFLIFRENGRHKIPFAYFGPNFDPSDVDRMTFHFWPSEARVETSPLRIFEIGVVPEPTTLALASVLVPLMCRRRCC